VTKPPRPTPAPEELAQRKFVAVYHAHFDLVWRILRRLGVPADQLEDAAQDVFLVLHRRLPELAPTISLRSWLFGTARRVASDCRRGLRRHERRVQALTVVTDWQPRERVAERAEATDFVQRFLDRLDQDKRMVFILADLEGFTAPEIAEALEVKLNTVYSRLRAARAEFERAITEADKDAEKIVGRQVVCSR
jgi:RNA polymerase sigma-70 factor (ECF subfamily)